MKGVIRKFFLEVFCLLRRSNMYRLMAVFPSAADARKESGSSSIPKEVGTLSEATLPRFKLHGSWLNPEDPIPDCDQEVTKRFYKRCSEAENLREGWIFKVIAGMDQGRQYMATTAILKIGRHYDNHVYLRDPKVSRHHALVTFLGGRIFIKDLQSTNGTWVNERRVASETELLPGGQIKIGETILQVEKISFKPLNPEDRLA